jgi:radical SAM modification target selenobiotic family peptide
MDAKDLKKYLAGLGIAGLLAGGGAIAADQPAAKAEDKTKTAPTSTAVKSEPSKTAPSKSG